MTWPFQNSTRLHRAVIISDNIANWLLFHGKDADWLDKQIQRAGFTPYISRQILDAILSGRPTDSETLAFIASLLPLPPRCRFDVAPKRFIRALERDRLQKLSKMIGAAHV